MNIYWMNSRNFGDALNPLIFAALTGQVPQHSGESPKLLLAGSIAHKAQPGDILWGTGSLTPYHKVSKGLDVRAVRGPLTHRILSVAGNAVPAVYGDPALLLPRLLPFRSKAKHRAGFFPHYSDAKRYPDMPPGYVRLQPMAPVKETLRKLLSCKMIISSSLHGVIVAEAYGIPAVWVRITRHVPTFKFWDYYLSTGREVPKPLDWSEQAYWGKAEQAARNWQPPEIDLDKLLEAWPLGDYFEHQS